MYNYYVHYNIYIRVRVRLRYYTADYITMLELSVHITL